MVYKINIISELKARIGDGKGDDASDIQVKPISNLIGKAISQYKNDWNVKESGNTMLYYTFTKKNI